MTSDLARAVKGGSGFLNGPDPCKGPGRSVLSMRMVKAGYGLVCPSSASEKDRLSQTK